MDYDYESEAEYAAFDQLDDWGIGRVTEDGVERPTAPDELVISATRAQEREIKLLEGVAAWCERNAHLAEKLGVNPERADGLRAAGVYCLGLVKERSR